LSLPANLIGRIQDKVSPKSLFLRLGFFVLKLNIFTMSLNCVAVLLVLGSMLSTMGFTHSYDDVELLRSSERYDTSSFHRLFHVY